MHTKKARRFSAIAVLLILWTIIAPIRAKAAGAYDELPEVDITSEAAILVYAQTGEILYRHNIHASREPASITKLLTCLLAVERAAETGGLYAPVTVEESDFFDITEDSSTAELRPGDVLTLYELLHCALIASANESCNVIARHIAGDVPSFITLMNERLAELGCENSRFANTHGLPDVNHYTTAYDLSLLVAACLESKTLLDIARIVSYTLPSTAAHPDGKKLTTTNRLLLDRPNLADSLNYYYEPALGLKTGSTNAAGLCLAAYAKRKGDDRVLISVVLGAKRQERDGITELRHFSETRALFEWGFENFALKTLVPKNYVAEKTDVRLGLDKDLVYLVAESSLEALVPSSLMTEDLTLEAIPLYPTGITAPVVRGAPMGTLKVSYQGKELGELNLIAAESIEKDSGEEIVNNIGGFFEQPWLRGALIAMIVLVAGYIALVFGLNAAKKRKLRPQGSYKGKKKRR